MKTLLLIEDNTDIRENTCELLELQGYHVIHATNGKSGLILAKEKTPDAILCDIMMPEADGYEVFNDLKNDPRTTSIPFIFLTASCEKKEVDAALGMGVSGYIRKPFDAKDLFDAIESCLKRD
jgi:CheY-like chemotaxis protein